MKAVASNSIVEATCGRTTETRSTVRYMVQLDGLRALAVGLVIIDHWASAFPRRIQELVGPLDLSRLGVEIFFVLSGFLITLILLHSKDAGDRLGTSLKQFYVRRVLRIFPIYYITLFIASIFSPDIRAVAHWHALYITNIYTSWFGTWIPAGHFWSLAVEEQFYLLWPVMVLVLLHKRIYFACWALFLLAPLSRLLLHHLHGGNHLAIYTSLITSIDLLCFGGLLAYRVYTEHRLPWRVSYRLIYLAGTAAFVAYWVMYKEWQGSVAFIALGRSSLAVAFGALVLAASQGIRGSIGRILSNRILVWIGTISYGIYIIHPFIPEIYLTIGRMVGADFYQFPYYIRIPVWLLLLILLTSCSFYFVEQPIRRLKRHFS